MHSRILSVDDNAVHLRLIEESLLGEEFQVVSSQNGRDAERIARSIRPDAVIIDLMMPQINGIQLCRQMKLDELTRHIPVVIVTAVNDRDMMLKALDSAPTTSCKSRLIPQRSNAACAISSGPSGSSTSCANNRRSPRQAI